MKFDINKYPGYYVMHCKTEEEAQNFCNYLHNIGRGWCDGKTYSNLTRWDIFEKNTVYCFNEGVCVHISKARQYGYHILEWSDFMNSGFTKADLRTGDVVLRRSGDVEIFNREMNMFIRKEYWNHLDSLNDDLTAPVMSQHDIIAVRRPNHPRDCQFSAFAEGFGTLVYERKDPEEMTLKEVCKVLGKNIKIVDEK